MFHTSRSKPAPLHHERSGAGAPPLVFAHGFGCARAVPDLLRALDLPPAVLTGHGLGCRVAMRARIGIAPNAGHFTMLESPAAMSRIVRETAERIRPAR